MQGKTNNYIAILAGGGGTRLWPKSRKAFPKQFLPLFDHQTLLQITFDRVRDIVSPDRVLIIASGDFEKIVAEQLSDLPRENIIIEPIPAGTAAAAGLAAIHVQGRSKNAVLSVIASDHYIKEKERFNQALEVSQETAEIGSFIVTLGLTPSFPHTGLGYIHSGAKKFQIGRKDVYEVAGFTEKPDKKTAERYLASGEYFWNANINSYKVGTLLGSIEEFMPELFKGLERVKANLQDEKILRQVWESLEAESIDTGVLEKAKNVLVIPADFTWLDIGDWSVLYELLASSADENVIVGGESEKVIHIGTKRTLIYPSHRLVGVIGLEDIVIIDTPDILLVCDKKKAQDVKALVQKLKEKSKEHYL